MKDNFSRRIIKRVARWRYETDLSFTRWLMEKRGDGPDFELKGQCNGCGGCCTTPMIRVHTVIFFARSTRWLLLAWHRVVNGFEFIDESRRDRTFIFRCTHYDPKTRLCDSYDSRPGMCRDYPRNLLYSCNPTFLQECSHYAESKNARRIRQSLEDLGLSEEEREALAARLHARATDDAEADPD
jgi:Fe-S-cluster containining protein